MTLRELFVPNKFGTVPIIDILGIGSVMYDPVGYANFYLSGYHKIIDLDTKVIIKDRTRLKVIHPDIQRFNSDYLYLVPMTPENYLVHNAIKPLNTVRCMYEGTLKGKHLTQHMIDTLHDDGSGWAEVHGELVPVTFYIEDILYRLDLQDKLT